MDERQFFSCTSYRQILMYELAARMERNPRYSQRAFARDLNIVPHRLSQVLSGKQGLSRARGKQLSEALKFSRTKSDFFCDLIDAEHGRSESARKLANLRLDKRRLKFSFSELQLESFRLIADWYHFAILELISLPRSESNAQWIACELGIKPTQAQEALLRMQSLGLIKKVDGKFVATQSNTVASEVPSVHIQTFHWQILDKAKHMLQAAPLAERKFNSLVLAISEDQLPEAKRLIEEFTDQFERLIGESSHKTEVYCLATQFFKLTRGRRDQDE